MLVMTAKVDKKKIFIVFAAAAALIAALFLLFGGSAGGETDATTAGAPSVSTNDARVQFLTDLGWQVTNSPTETSQVKIPKESSDVYDRYNALQKSQGYDLSQFAGKTVMRYVYQIQNYPGATEPVYATLLIYKNQIIGGDVTNTAPGGTVQGFRMPKDTATQPSVETEPAAAITPTETLP